ncbi:MAG: NAD(P)H-dependent glycerol-3-phosphate dehydrogenase [bacterium]
MNDIAFVGAGRWALALALNFARAGRTCLLWEPNRTSLERLRASRRHPDLPESCEVGPPLRLCPTAAEAMAEVGTLVFAVPSAALAEIARDLRGTLPRPVRTIVTVTKGIDPATLRRLSLVLAEALPGLPVVVLAGPGIPWDFALGDPTTLVAASEDDAAADAVRDDFTAGNLRVYSSRDVAGVEIAAALKNVIAIAAGVADGLGLGINARAALLSRGLAEMTRLGISQNANPLTFSGLAGVGDLVVTAFSENSRNHTLGRLIGTGLSLAEATARLNGIAEGAVTVGSALALAARAGVELPIAQEVDAILHRGGDARRSLRRLFSRNPKREDSW